MNWYLDLNLIPQHFPGKKDAERKPSINNFHFFFVLQF